jgi:hypothetical protein
MCVTKTYEGIVTIGEIIIFASPWLILTIAFYHIQKKQLRIKEINIKFTEKEFQEAVQRTVTENGWQIENNKDNLFRAFHSWDMVGGFGEMITIMWERDRLFLNSICNPNITSSFLSFGWNTKNIDIFLKNLNDVKQHISYVGKTEKQKKAWTFGKLFMRFYIYQLFLAFIAFGVFFLFFLEDSSRLKGIGVGMIILPSVILYSDLKVLKKEFKKGQIKKILGGFINNFFP